MKPFASAFAAIAMVLPVASAADTFVLKNGDKVVGDLIRETEDSYVVEVHLAPTIREERTIAKDKVNRIEKPEAGKTEYEQIKEFSPAPDGLRAQEYKQRIDLLTQFIEKFPSNSKVRKAMEIRDELRDEMRQVEDGAVKIDGVLYPAAELRENEYELDARIEARKIKDLIEDREFLQALRAYKEFKQDYANTQVHLDLIPQIQQLISAHSAQATMWRNTLDDRIELREKGLERMKPGDRRDSERAIEEEKQQLSRRFRLETAANVGWVTVHPFCKEALDFTVQYAKNELRQIDNLLNKDFVDYGKMYRKLFQLNQQGAEEKAIRDMVRDMQKAGVPDRYLEKFKAAAGGRK